MHKIKTDLYQSEDHGTNFENLSQKNQNKTKMYRFKMAVKQTIFISPHFDLGQNLKKKNTFPKEFFNEFWLKVG